MSIPTSPTHIGYVHWFPDLNFGRGAGTAFPTDEAKVAGEDNVLVDSYARTGRWLPTFPVETMEISADRADKAVVQRKDWLSAAEILAKSSEIGKILLAILTVRYMDKKGNVIRPTMLGVTGNRRSAAIDLGFLRRLGRNPSDESPEDWPGPSSRNKSESHEAWVRRLCNFDLYFSYRADVKSEDDMLILQIEENELKNVGGKKVALAKNLEHTRKLLQHGFRQADIVRVFGPSGQKMSQVCLLDMQVPQLGLIERLGLKQNDPRHLRFGKLPNSLSRLLAATSPDPSEIKKFNSRKGREEKDLIKESLVGKLDQVDAEVKAFMGSGTEEPDMMDKDTITTQIRVNSQNPLICDVLMAVKAGEVGLLAKAVDSTAAVRALYVLMDDKETYQQVENLLMKLAETKVSDRAKLLKKSA